LYTRVIPYDPEKLNNKIKLDSHKCVQTSFLTPNMKVPFVDPVSAFLLFFQTLFLYLHYSVGGFWSDDHWGVYFLPSFIGLIFLVAMLMSEALFEGRKNVVQGLNEVSQTKMSHVLFQMLTGVMVLLTLVLYVFYLDEDTDLPIYWITTSLFATTILATITLILIYQAKCTPRDGSWVYIFVAILVLSQGLFIWLYNSQWGRIMKVPAWVIALPTFIFLLASFYRTLVQTYQQRTDIGPQMVRQFSFLFLILMVLYVVLASVIHASNPDISWVRPRWIALTFMVYTILLVISSIYVYWKTPSRDDMTKKTDIQYRNPDYDENISYVSVATYTDGHKGNYTDQTTKQNSGFAPGYNPVPFGHN
jgi:hypothetical protein